MSGTIAYDAGSDELVVSFRFDRTLKDRVKQLPGARFEWTSKTWRFPVSATSAVVDALTPLGFTVHGLPTAAESPAASRGDDAHTESARPASARRGGDAYATHGLDTRPAARPPDTIGRDGDLTVASLNARLAATVSSAWPAPIWVTGSLTNMPVGRAGHLWFELVEEDERRGVVASVKAVMFASTRQNVERRLRSAGLALEEGLAARLRCRVEVYARRGTLQLVVDDIDPTWSLGDLELRREQVLAALRTEGLVDRQRALPFPRLPKRVALLTSADSDAYHDFVSTLHGAGFPIEVTPYDVRVQGAGLKPSVLAALAHADRGHFDLVVITRGGGSRVELGAWDDLDVARAVARCDTKVLVAIGHHQDRSVLDDLATHAKTPTEAAEYVVAGWAEAERTVRRMSDRLAAAVRSRVSTEHTRVEASRRALAVAARRSLSAHRARVDVRLPQAFERAAEQRLRRARTHLERTGARSSPDAALRRLAARSAALERLAASVARAAADQLRRERARVRLAATQLRLVDPANVLRRGYAIVRGDDAQPITRVTALADGREVQLQMQDGEARVTVADIAPYPPADDD